MKSIQIEDDLYHFIASQTQDIGESASDILRRLIMPEPPLKAEQNTSTDLTNHVIRSKNAVQTRKASIILSELGGLRLPEISKMVERWLLVLSIIHKHNSRKFKKVLAISGRNRTYFATNKVTLLETGSSTNPKNVPGSNYWVITNNNTVKKINMLKEVAEHMSFNLSEIEQLIAIFAPEYI